MITVTKMSFHRLLLLTAAVLLVTGGGLCTECPLTNTTTNWFELLIIQPNIEHILFQCDYTNAVHIAWCKNTATILHNICEGNCLNLSRNELMTMDKEFIYCTLNNGVNYPCTTFNILPSTHNTQDYYCGHLLHIHATICAPLSPPLNGQIKYDIDDTTPKKYQTFQKATYVCDDGYVLRNGNETRRCESNCNDCEGEWSGRDPTCDAITCQALDDPRNGSIYYYNANGSKLVDVPENVDVGIWVKYSCDGGFGFSGDSNMMICQTKNSTHGEWSGVPPKCTNVVCSINNLTQPTNGNFSITPPANGNLAVYGSKVNYTCDEGFSLVGGNSIRTCSEVCNHGTVGEWGGQKPICQHVVCSINNLTQPTNGNFSITPSANGNLAVYGSKVNYTCNEGFSLVEGNSIRTCSEGCDHGTVGEWDGQKPICQLIRCSPLVSPWNGHDVTYSDLISDIDTIDPLPFGTIASYWCNVQSNSLKESRMCGGNSIKGVWNGTAPNYSCIRNNGTTPSPLVLVGCISPSLILLAIIGVLGISLCGCITFKRKSLCKECGQLTNIQFQNDNTTIHTQGTSVTELNFKNFADSLKINSNGEGECLQEK